MSDHNWSLLEPHDDDECRVGLLLARWHSVQTDFPGDSTVNEWRLDRFGLSDKNTVSRKGAIGFDWVAISKGGVPWLISWPR
jgi:hypothetical protein